MRKLYVKVLAITIATTLVMGIPTKSMAASNAISKEENIYAILNHNGEVDHMYAVNAYEVEKAGMITDYGNYNLVRNMTTTDEIAYQDGVISVDAPEGRFYYQGNTDENQLPWDIAIGYKLDGNEIKADELIGKSGAVEIKIQVKKNKEVNEDYFNHFSLQISLSLDGDKFNDITADGATMANAGNNKSITFTHLPGKENSYIIKANTTDFELDPIQINGVLLSMNIELDGVDSMTDGLKSLTDGILDLNEGTKGLKEGSENFQSGLNDFAKSTSTIKSSSGQIKGGIASSATSLSDLLASTAGLKDLATLLSTSEDPNVQALANGYLTQIAALEQLSAGLTSLSSNYAEFDNGIGQVTDGIDSLADGYKGLDQGIASLAEGVGEMYDNTSNLDSEVEEQIDGMMSQFTSDDYKPVSFISEENTDVKSVQFIIRTNSLEKVEDKVPVKEEKKELSFWQKLLKLFGLYKEDE